MKTRPATDRARYRTMGTRELRDAFLLEGLFREGELSLTYLENERMIVGSAVPLDKELVLEAGKGMAAEYFCQRRELGILNVGGPGRVIVDGEGYDLLRLDCLYVGRGARHVSFMSAGAAIPARLYLLSLPAHATHPTAVARKDDAEPTRLGSAEEANERTIHKCIHPEGITSCQLVMGYTTLETGSIWNTMPPHTHERRTEVYMYFDLDDGAVVHLMGEPAETRHLVVRNGQAVLSPTWSIHTGAGTRAYTFCWGMGGENQEFADMDAVGTDELQ